MRMTLDFSDARTSRCHSYAGVRARIDGGPETVVTIGPDGCRLGTAAGPTFPCESPEIDHVQASSVAMLLTGSETSTPRNGIWDMKRKVVTYNLGQTRRMMMS